MVLSRCSYAQRRLKRVRRSLLKSCFSVALTLPPSASLPADPRKIVPLLVNVNNFRPQIESTLSTTMGRPVKVGNLSLGVFSGSVGADQLSIADDPKFSSAPFIQAKSLQVGVELMPLIFSKQLNITKIVIDHPEMTLLRNREGVWNFSSLGKSAQPGEKTSSTPANVNVAKFDLDDGTVTVGSLSGKRKPIVYNKVNITMRNFSFTDTFPVVASVGLRAQWRDLFAALHRPMMVVRGFLAINIVVPVVATAVMLILPVEPMLRVGGTPLLAARRGSRDPVREHDPSRVLLPARRHTDAAADPDQKNT